MRAARGSHNAGSVNRDVLHRSYRPVLDVNIVTDCLDGQALDLVIATNVFIYYDVFEQALTMSYVEAMLKPRRVSARELLRAESNLAHHPPLETTTTVYARGVNENIRDFIVWYRPHAN